MPTVSQFHYGSIQINYAEQLRRCVQRSQFHYGSIQIGKKTITKIGG